MTGNSHKQVFDFDHQHGSNEAREFRSLALRYSEIAADEGVRVTPYLSEDMPLFQKASQEQRRIATEALRNIVSIHEEVIAAGERGINSARLLWRAMSKFSLTPEGDIFDRFTDEDSVLIYNDQHAVIFWNLQWFRCVSFTLEQIFFGKWHECTRRDPEVLAKLVDLVTNISTGKVKGTFDIGVPGHEVMEVGSPENLRLWMNIPWGSVLTKNGSLAGFLIVQQVRILD